jgi:hypothetical protein
MGSHVATDRHPDRPKMHTARRALDLEGTDR